MLSPLGFGLDERARSAIEHWSFAPGTQVTIDVHFRLGGQYFNKKAEERRTQFNLAVRRLKRLNGQPDERLVKTIQDLARQKFPPAMYLLGGVV